MEGSGFLFKVGGSMKRARMGRRKSKRSFTAGAMRVHPRNLSTARPMRGGIRL